MQRIYFISPVLAYSEFLYMFETDIFRKIVEVIHYYTYYFIYNRNLLTFIYTEMATKEDCTDEEIARRLYLDEIEEQRENEEIRIHNEIAERNYQEELYKQECIDHKERLKQIKKEQRKKEKYYLMEIQKHIIIMLDLNLRFNNAQTFEEKQRLFQDQIQFIEYLRVLQKDLLELMSYMTI